MLRPLIIWVWPFDTNVQLPVVRTDKGPTHRLLGGEVQRRKLSCNSPCLSSSLCKKFLSGFTLVAMRVTDTRSALFATLIMSFQFDSFCLAIAMSLGRMQANRSVNYLRQKHQEISMTHNKYKELIGMDSRGERTNIFEWKEVPLAIHSQKEAR